MQKKTLKLIECPRDAMQGWKKFIPTEKKIEYISCLLEVGFDTIDFGSFVSPKAIPQMADTRLVAEGLDLKNSPTKLLSIIANTRGAEEAASIEKISLLGFPFSVSPTFQMRNTHSTIAESLDRVRDIKRIGDSHNKEVVIYISMAFGNPYGDPYSEDKVLSWINTLVEEGIRTISLADTVGLALPSQVSSLVQKVTGQFKHIETGVHLHSTARNWKEKLDAALQNGCRRFDGALKGIGGCPMADDELVGNMDTELMIPYFRQQGFLEGLNESALKKAGALASQIFI